MNLKMNNTTTKKSRCTSSKSIRKPNGSIVKKSSKYEHIKIKEEVYPFSEDELIIQPNAGNAPIIKYEQSEDEAFEHSGSLPKSYDSNSHFVNSPSGSENSSQSPSPSPPLTSHPKNATSLTNVSCTGSSLVPKPSQSIFLNRLPTNLASKSGSPLTNFLLIDSRPYQLIPHQVASNDASARELHHLQLRVVSSPPQQQQLQQQQQHQQQHIHKQLPLIAPLPLQQPTSLSSSSSVSHRTISTPLISSTLKFSHNTLDRSNSLESVDTPEDTEEEGSGAHDGLGAAESEVDYQSDSAPPKDLDSHDGTPTSSQDSNYPMGDSDCPIPNLLNETGTYGFRVLLDAKEDTLKTPTWLVSNITNKLYTNMNKPIPFRVVLKKPYQKKKFFLRAMAVFKYPMFLRQNVLRCPNHLNPVDSTNIDFPHIKHVIRADHPRALYDTTHSGRLSVVVPLDFPEGRSEAIPILLKFMCHNSCVGGINRRPMAILLTLENNDEEVGRYTIDVRVCACPSRDVKTEEKQLIAKGLCTKSGHIFENRRNRKRPRNEEPNSMDDEDEIYHLPVRGAVLYNYLRDVKIMYLKHHPEYARKYPDPPNEMHMRLMEELGHQEALPEMGEEIHLPESPQEEHHESPMTEGKPQPVIFLYSNNGDKLPPKVLMEEELPPEVRNSIVESFQSSGSRKGVSSVGDQSPRRAMSMFIKKEKNSYGSEEDECGPPFVPSLFTPSTLPEKHTKKKCRTPNGKHKSGESPRNHLQVPVMPEKHKGLLNVMPKGREGALYQPLRPRASSEESEKVMLAAQVLASHLGSH